MTRADCRVRDLLSKQFLPFQRLALLLDERPTRRSLFGPQRTARGTSLPDRDRHAGSGRESADGHDAGDVGGAESVRWGCGDFPDWRGAGLTVGRSDAAAWSVTECGECDARVQHDSVRFAPAVQDIIPNEAVEIRNQWSACVVEAVRDVGRIAAEFGGTFRDAGCWKQRAGLVLREGNRYDLQTRGACVPIA